MKPRNPPPSWRAFFLLGSVLFAPACSETVPLFPKSRCGDQICEWVWTFGSGFGDSASAVVLVPDGIVVAATGGRPLSLDADLLWPTGSGSFLAYLSLEGSLRRAQLVAMDVRVDGLVTLPSGVGLSTWFRNGTVDFAGRMFSATEARQGVVSLHEAQGALTEAFTVTTAGAGRALAMAVWANDLVLAGTYSGTLANGAQNVGEQDGFVASLTPAGQLRWAVTLTSSGSVTATDVCVDAGGRSSSAFSSRDPVTLPGQEPRPAGAYLMSLDAAGQIAQVVALPFEATAVACASTSLVCVAGTVSPEVAAALGFGAATGGPFGGTDVAVAAYDPAGRLVWGQLMGGPGDDAVGALTGTKDGCVVAGTFVGPARFGDRWMGSTAAAGIFGTRLTLEGRASGVMVLPVSETHAVLDVVANDETYYVAGQWSGLLGTNPPLQSRGKDGDGFVLKVHP